MKYSCLALVRVPQTHSAQLTWYQSGARLSFWKAVRAAVLLPKSASPLPGSLSDPESFCKVSVQCCSSLLTTSHLFLAFTLRKWTQLDAEHGEILLAICIWSCPVLRLTWGRWCWACHFEVTGHDWSHGKLYENGIYKLDTGFLLLTSCPCSAEWHEQDPEQVPFLQTTGLHQFTSTEKADPLHAEHLQIYWN